MTDDKGMLKMLAGNIAGGAAATYADAALPQHAYTVGKDANGMGGVTIQPGLMGGLALGLLVAVAGKKLPARDIVASVAVGAVVVEGANLAERHLVPYIAPAPGSLAAAPTPAGVLNAGPPGAVATQGYWSGVGACGPSGGVSDYDVANMMRVYEGAA